MTYFCGCETVLSEWFKCIVDVSCRLFDVKIDDEYVAMDDNCLVCVFDDNYSLYEFF